MIPRAEALFRGSKAHLLPAFAEVYDELDGWGCLAVVKTIYVTFALDGRLVAAAHPASTYFEIALPNAPGKIAHTYDASHLKWSMLPRGVAVTGEGDVPQAIALLRIVRNSLDPSRTD
jgi:hypothetical protein